MQHRPLDGRCFVWFNIASHDSGRCAILSIFFLERNGPVLSSEACDLLYQAACAMHTHDAGKALLRTRFCTGEVATEGKHVSIAALSGKEFTATIETPKGTTRLRYVVPTNDLRRDPEPTLWLYITFGSAFKAPPAAAHEDYVN